MNDVTTAEKVLEYGDRAVAQGTRVAEAPQSKQGGPPPPAKPPAHVAAARSIWQASFAAAIGTPAVTIEDLGKAPSAGIRKSTFQAWTNSATQIFVSKGLGTDAAALHVVLHHEAEHIKQFRSHGNKPPGDYAAMMTYECQAYGASATMTQGHSDPNIAQYHPDMKAAADSYRNEIKRVEALTKDLGVRNAEYKKFLKLPQHKTLADLYR
ncbi:hypothetical protein [Nocardioides sp. GXQ0305]|uniref:hypothetical protein n=1 Tax=Nocardioides sp. GXQ0305 TaxID=3423912 RepID=UPI003D7E07DD